MATPGTSDRILAEANALAREAYRLMGYVAREGYRFDKARGPREQLCWRFAVVAYDHLAATEIDEVADEVDAFKEAA